MLLKVFLSDHKSETHITQSPRVKATGAGGEGEDVTEDVCLCRRQGHYFGKYTLLHYGHGHKSHKTHTHTLHHIFCTAEED